MIPEEGFDFENLFRGGLEILESINAYKGVVFLDTILTRDNNPGRLHVCSPPDYRETLHLSCRHDVDFRTALEIGRKTGFIIPENLLVIGIEILEDLEFGNTLSNDLGEQYDAILSLVTNHIEEFSRLTQMKTKI
jgi:hydrogenase maturation protease